MLVIDEAFATTKDSGKRIRTANLLEACAESFAITYAAYADSADEAFAAEQVWRARGVETCAVPAPKVGKSGVAQVLTLAKTLGRRLPASVAAWRTTEFRNAVTGVVGSGHFDLIHCEITQMAWAVPFAAGIPTVLDAHNVEAVIWERLADLQGLPTRWIFRDQAAKMSRYERAVLPRFDAVACVSDLDRERMRSRYGVRRAVVVPNGVAAEIEPLAPASGPPVLMYPAALNWRPAQDGAVFLLREILPLIRSTCPDVQVEIVGKDPPRWLRSLCAATPGVVCYPDVPTMEPHYRRAQVVAVPLRVGSGSRLKILEALAYGRAVVSTTVGAEGLDLADGVHLSIADGAHGFAAAVCRLLNDPRARSSYGIAGRRAVEDRYLWTGIGEKMMEVWRTVAGADRGIRFAQQGER